MRKSDQLSKYEKMENGGYFRKNKVQVSVEK